MVSLLFSHLSSLVVGVCTPWFVWKDRFETSTDPVSICHGNLGGGGLASSLSMYNSVSWVYFIAKTHISSYIQ